MAEVTGFGDREFYKARVRCNLLRCMLPDWLLLTAARPKVHIYSGLHLACLGAGLVE